MVHMTIVVLLAVLSIVWTTGYLIGILVVLQKDTIGIIKRSFGGGRVKQLFAISTVHTFTSAISVPPVFFLVVTSPGWMGGPNWLAYVCLFYALGVFLLHLLSYRVIVNRITEVEGGLEKFKQRITAAIKDAQEHQS